MLSQPGAHVVRLNGSRETNQTSMKESVTASAGFCGSDRRSFEESSRCVPKFITKPSEANKDRVDSDSSVLGD